MPVTVNNCICQQFFFRCRQPPQKLSQSGWLIGFPLGEGNSFFHHVSMILSDYKIESIAERSMLSVEVRAKYNLIITINVNYLYLFGIKKHINTSLKTKLKPALCKTVYSLIFGLFFEKQG
jgi:hypothetical protein